METLNIEIHLSLLACNLLILHQGLLALEFFSLLDQVSQL